MSADDGIEASWTRLCALSLDRTSWGAVWMACERKGDIVRVYSVAKGKPLPPLPVMAETINRRCMTMPEAPPWIPVLTDLFAFGRNEADGRALGARLVNLLPNLNSGTFEEEAGIREVEARLSTGRLLVEEQCRGWLEERLGYRRSTVTGKLPEDGYHLMRATGLGLMLDPHEWLSEARAASDARGYEPGEATASKVTGY